MRSVSADHAAVFENIGAAISVLRRLNNRHLDADVRHEIAAVRQTLSLAQSRVYHRMKVAHRVKVAKGGK